MSNVMMPQKKTGMDSIQGAVSTIKNVQDVYSGMVPDNGSDPNKGTDQGQDGKKSAMLRRMNTYQGTV